jgi:hypothetical protein
MQIVFKLIWTILRLGLRIIVFGVWIASSILEFFIRNNNDILRAYLFNERNPNDMSV